MYLAFQIDVYSRMIVGWSIATQMRTDLVVDALRMALGTPQPGADGQLVTPFRSGVATRTQPVLATVPVDVTVLWRVTDSGWLRLGTQLGDAAVVAEARPEGRAGAAIAACAPSVHPPQRARSSLSLIIGGPGG